MNSGASPIHVLQLGSPSGLFGAERWILALAKHLPPSEVRTTIGVIDDRECESLPPLIELAASLGFETLTIRAPGKINLDAARRLAAAVSDRDIHVMNSHFYKSTLICALARHRTGRALVATPHGWSAGRGLRLRAYEGLERIAFGWADAVVPLSVDLADQLSSLPWIRKKVFLIRNGVDLEEVRQSSAVADDVRRAKADGKYVVGFVGQLVERKRVATLVNAFARLDIKKKQLFILGDGEDRSELEDLVLQLGVSGDVTFTGFRADRLDFVRGCDVIVLPSAVEGVPRCLMEAMASNVAVIGSDIPGNRDLIRDRVTGLLFPLDHVERLTECLALLAANAPLREAMANTAAKLIQAEFSAVAMSMRYTKLYKKLTDRRNMASSSFTNLE